MSKFSLDESSQSFSRSNVSSTVDKRQMYEATRKYVSTGQMQIMCTLWCHSILFYHSVITFLSNRNGVFVMQFSVLFLGSRLIFLIKVLHYNAMYRTVLISSQFCNVL